MFNNYFEVSYYLTRNQKTVVYIIFIWHNLTGGKLAQAVTNLPANAGDPREVGSIPGLGRSPDKGMAANSSILARRIACTEEA